MRGVQMMKSVKRGIKTCNSGFVFFSHRSSIRLEANAIVVVTGYKYILHLTSTSPPHQH